MLLQNRETLITQFTPPPTLTPTQSPVNLALRARLYERDNEFAKAIETYEQVIDIDATDIRNYIKLIELLVQVGDSERALELAADAVDLAPQNDKVWEVKANAHLHRGDQLNAIGDDGGFQYSRAVDAGESASQLNIDNARAHAYTASGWIRQGLNYSGEAQESADIALITIERQVRDGFAETLDPVVLYHYADVQNYQAERETAQLRLEQAREIFERNQTFTSDYVDALLTLASINFFYRNNPKGAVDLLQGPALDVAPENANVLDALAYYNLVIGNYADAESYARQAVAANGQMIRARAHLGHAYYKNSNYPEAIKELQVAIDGYGSASSNTSVYFAMLGLAYYFEDVQNCPVAVPLFQSALAVSVVGSAGEISASEGVDFCRQVQLSQP
ncbi:MAG: tetratricopeptide repeat protein [Candidatus Promineifilaceae bacterium]